MDRVLMILEVSQKQAYIFGSNKLRTNLQRSEQIRRVTGSDYLQQAAPGLFDPADNLVYTGGGHTVLQFADPDTARRFGRAISRRVLQDFPGMELYQHLMPYDDTAAPGANLTALSAELEAKKSRRQASFRQISFGVEAPAAPAREETPPAPGFCPAGWQLTTELEQIAGQDNFVGIVHIDGNAMGKRVQKLYEGAGSADWQGCVARLRRFSQGIDDDFAAAYQQTAEALAAFLEKADPAGSRILPLRRIIGAGDDVCFVTAGSLALDAAATFLRALAARRNPEDGGNYPACAGVVLIHRKSPFRAAYDLSEELCSHAKTFGAAIDPAGGVSAMDWHIEFGSQGGSLAALRRHCRSRDGALLYLRPVAVALPADRQELWNQPWLAARSYRYFRALVKNLQQRAEGIPRSKLKDLRDALRQGELETRLALRSRQMTALLELGLEERYPDYLKALLKGETMGRGAFVPLEEPGGGCLTRCLYFDGVEMMDHMTQWGED